MPLRWLKQSELAPSTGDLTERGDELGDQLQSDDTLFHALELMVQSASGCSVVVDEAGRFQGCVEMPAMSAAIRRAQREAQLHYEELEARS